MTRGSEELSNDYRRYLAALVHFHQAAADRSGLSGTDYQASNLLDVDGPLTSSELAHRLGLSTGATTRLVDRLIAAGIAERHPSANDRRTVSIHHTGYLPDGLESALNAVRAPIAGTLNSLTPEQLQGVRLYLDSATDSYTAAARSLTTPPD